MDSPEGIRVKSNTQTRINCEKYSFCIVKSLKHLKNLKTDRIPYLGLELTNDHGCPQKSNPSCDTVTLIYRPHCVRRQEYNDGMHLINMFLHPEVEPAS